MVSVAVKEYLEPGAKERQNGNLKKGKQKPEAVKLPEREKGDTRDQAAAMLGISGKDGGTSISLDLDLTGPRSHWTSITHRLITMLTVPWRYFREWFTWRHV
jgi:hypothetical protein